MVPSLLEPVESDSVVESPDELSGELPAVPVDESLLVSAVSPVESPSPPVDASALLDPLLEPVVASAEVAPVAEAPLPEAEAPPDPPPASARASLTWAEMAETIAGGSSPSPPSNPPPPNPPPCLRSSSALAHS